jgi:hypothetical protein
MLKDSITTLGSFPLRPALQLPDLPPRLNTNAVGHESHDDMHDMSAHVSLIRLLRQTNYSTYTPRHTIHYGYIFSSDH